MNSFLTNDKEARPKHKNIDPGLNLTFCGFIMKTTTPHERIQDICDHHHGAQAAENAQNLQS